MINFEPLFFCLMRLETPETFNFRRTVNSHGWSRLLPFELSEDFQKLDFVFSDSSLKEPVEISVRHATENELDIKISGKISEKAKQKVAQAVHHILRFDENLGEFYNIIKKDKEFKEIAKNGMGRLLRSPTVYEDLVKTICTTNCSWALTTIMTKNLVEKLGEKTSGGKHSFPTAEKMAEMSPDFYRAEIRAGYRSPFFQELAEKVASGQLNPEEWLLTDISTKELKKQMKQVKGVGDYAAENLLKLVGRYDGLALDSWLRAQFYRRHNNGLTCPDKEIENFYSRFGEWKGLAIWCDMTREWVSG